MECVSCENIISRNLNECPECGEELKGGVVFVTGISGSGVRAYLDKALKYAEEHGHEFVRHDIGHIMRRHADEHKLDVQWDRILDADERALMLLRALALQEVAYSRNMKPAHMHIVDLHLCFRWRAYLSKGFEPHTLEQFTPHARLFINIIEDLASVHGRLLTTSWGDRQILELLIWRDEELHLTDIFADMCGLDRCYAVAAGEPPSMFERLVWHPEYMKVYLSFPITNLLEDGKAGDEIRGFRDRIREFLIVFDPYACKDYDETYVREEMKYLRKEIGDITEERDYRFIDQADAVVVYFPKIVPSKGVEAEMNYARRTGKSIFMYRPKDERDEGPFAVPPSHYSPDPDAYIELLKGELLYPSK